MPSHYIVAALYKFVKLEDYLEMRIPLLDECKRLNIIGTILLAKEGINGTIAGQREDIDQILAHLRQDPRLGDLEHKESVTDRLPFFRMRVRLKKEIVTIGIPTVDPSAQVGTYVQPKEWNELINDPSVVVIDTRNDYEVQAGTFKNAVNPHTQAFGEFPAYVKGNLDPAKTPKVAMFCTGGIRCEKASSYMLQNGFTEVYHLKGGILKYLEEVPKEKSLWQGKCFVFDHRDTVGHEDFQSENLEAPGN